MKAILSFSLLLLTAIIMMGGMVMPVAAQDDPIVLVKIAKNAQEQIRTNISENTPDKAKQLFREGSYQVDALTASLGNNDVESAKKHFLSSMRIFKDISQMLAQNTSQAFSAANSTYVDPSSELLKLYRYSSSLKTITEKYQASINFTQLDSLFVTANEQINTNQLSKAQETIHRIKEIIVDIEKQLRDQTSPQELQRAHKYAQKYIEQLDRLIESAKNQQISTEIINMLEEAKNDLSSATDPEDIVYQIRKIISLKAQFELTKNDLLETRIMQVEKTLIKLSNEQVNFTILEEAKQTLQEIKHHLSKNQFEQANEQLKNLTEQLNEVQKSVS